MASNIANVTGSLTSTARGSQVHDVDDGQSDVIDVMLYSGVAVGILSVLVNLLSLTAMRFLRDKPSADLRFLTNLSVTDMLAALSFVIAQFTPPYDIRTADSLVPIASYILRSSPWMFLTAYLLTLTSLSVNQYLAVCRPWRYSVMVTGRRITIVLLALWSFSALQILVPVVIVCARSLRTSASGSKVSLGMDFAYASAIEIQVWMALFTLIITANIVLNALVYQQIRALKRRLANRPDSDNIRVKQRAFVTITYLLATGIFLWVPFPVMGIITINIEMTISGFMVKFISVTLNMLLYLNCFIDPFIYGTRIMEVRRAYKDMLLWFVECVCPNTEARDLDSPPISQTVTTSAATPAVKLGNIVTEMDAPAEENEVLI